MDSLRLPFITAQAQLDGQLQYVVTPIRCPSIFKFNADKSATIPIRFMTGELGLGDPFAMKFFRGIAFYGVGSAQARVFVDKAVVEVYRPLGHAQYGLTMTYGDIEMAETPDPERVLWLPRGTKGRTINIEASGSIKHIRSIVVFWDPLKGEEDG